MQYPWVNPYLSNPYMTQQPQPTIPLPQPTNGIIKVNGRDSALQS